MSSSLPTSHGPAGQAGQLFPPLPAGPGPAAPRPLRVCIASPEFIGPTRNGGIGTAYTAMAHALAAAGHQVTCLYLEGENVASRGIRHWIDHYKRDGIELVPLPVARTPALDAPHHAANAYAAYAWLKQHDHFDIIHFPEWRGPGYYALHAKRQGLGFARTIICIGTHSTTRWVMAANRECITDLAELEKDHMERQSVELADVVISPSQYLLDYIAERGWKLPPATYVQQNILPFSARGPANSSAPPSHAITEVVFFGRLETRKGVVLFCDALDRLAASKNANIRAVTFLGKEATLEGLPSAAYLERRAQKWDWKTQIIADRDQPQAMAYLSDPGRLAVIPSLLENSPYTVLECLGARIAFAAARVGGIPELIAPEDVDRVCFEPKPAALAAQLQRALSSGFQPARAAVDARANEQAWLEWHARLPLPEPAHTPESPALPKVTLGLVTYNRPKLLRQALASIETLDYPNLEVVLVDDGSTAPDALAALDELEPTFAQRGWKIVRQENKYLGAARNTAARHATGEYLLFMDDDNFAESYEVSTLVRAAQHSGADIVACGMNYFSGQAAPDLKTLPKGRWLPLGGAAAAGALRNCFGDANALVKRSCFESLGGFTEDYGITHEDWEFHARAVLRGFTLTVIPEFLFWYRVNADSMIRTLSRYPNYMRSIRPYVQAVPEPLRDLIYFAQGQQLRLTHTLGRRPPDATESRLIIAWRSKLEAARIFLQQKQSATAIQLLLDAVKAVEGSHHPFIIYDALIAVGQEMIPLDRGRAETMLRLALDLAKALQNEELEHPVNRLLATLNSGSKAAPPKAQSATVPAPAPNAKPAPMAANAGPAAPSTVPACPTSERAGVSVIIPVYNNLNLTQACLASLVANPAAGLSEIVVVDNASTDGTREYLEQEQKAGRLRLLVNARNEGFAHACNQGAQVARGTLLVFLNNDTCVTAGWLEALVRAAQRPQTGIVGAKLLYADHSIQHAGIDFINGIPDHPHRHAPADAPEVNQFRELDMVTGACLAIHRDVFLKLAGFDEAYQNGVEDIDLCLRARAAGLKVVYEPKAVVYHLEGQSAGRFAHVTENLQLFFQRWANCFDAQMRFRVPKAPAFKAASRSVLSNSSRASVVAAGTSPAASLAAPIKVAWDGSFLDYGSLSQVNRELTAQLPAHLSLTRVGRPGPNVPQALSELAAALRPEPPTDVQVTVRHAWPPNWQRPRTGKLVVIQPWEYGVLPVDWVRDSKQVDEFWVPTRYVHQVYVESGVPAEKVRVVPNGIDPERFRPEAAPLALPTQKRFKFLFVGGTIHRKGPDVLLEAYLNTFTAEDNVCLVIKDFGGQSCYAGQTMTQAIDAARRRPNAPEILHLTDELPPESLPGLYTACDCLAHPYRGEGFGLPILEAMACGLPVVITAGGAADDFALEEFSYRIPAVRKPIGNSISGLKLAGTGWLLEPDARALAAQLKRLVEHSDEARAKGRAASAYARREWTWSRAALIAAERLTHHASGATRPASPARAALALPPCALVGHLGNARDLFTRKKPREAWEATVAALRVRPFHPEAYLLLAEIAQTVGDGQTARVCAEHARRIAPAFKPARQFLNRRLQGSSRPAWLIPPPGLAQPATSPRPRLSVCLIAKNEEKFLGQCLASVQGLAEQIVVVDTGSTDRTVDIARAHGAEVHQFAWCDDFSAARNAALEHVTGDWVLALDADEELSPDSREQLRQHLEQPAAMAWRLPLRDAGREAQGCSYLPRLFRNAPGLFYVGRVHEQVFSSLEVRRAEWGLENRPGEALLVHYGYTEEMTRDRKKVERNLALLERAIEELPGEPQLLMSLGLELSRSGREAEALVRYHQAFDAMAAQPAAHVTPELRDTLLSQFSTRLAAARQFDEIVRVLTSAPAKSGTGLSASLHFALGLARMELGQLREAAENFQQCLAKRSQRALAPINPAINTAAPFHCLALCQMRLGQAGAAEKAFLDGMNAPEPGAQLRLDYAGFLLEQNRPVEALHRLHETVSENAQNSAAWRLGGQIALSQPGFLEFAGDWTSEAIQHVPQDDFVRAQRAEALLLSRDTAAARPLWERLWSNDRKPAALAALILCELLEGAALHAPQNAAESTAVSRAFLDWYRRCITFGAREIVSKVNARVEHLRPILPEATQILAAVAAETERPAAEVCAA